MFRCNTDRGIYKSQTIKGTLVYTKQFELDPEENRESLKKNSTVSHIDPEKLIFVHGFLWPFLQPQGK